MSLLGKQLSIRFKSPGTLAGFSIGGTDVEPDWLVFDEEANQSFLPPVAHGTRTGSSRVLEELVRTLRPLFHGNTSDETVLETALKIRVGTTSEIRANLPNVSNVRSWRDSVATLLPSHPLFKKLELLVWARWTPWLVRQADAALADFAQHVAYMGPFRAPAQRYYRAQDLAVNELDYRGENLAMFLKSLDEPSRLDFSNFLTTHFDIAVTSRTLPGHVSITIKEARSPSESNLADIGFGYSQLLPVVAQVWSAIERADALDDEDAELERPSPTLVAIEQPELHLHPASQAQLGDLFVGSLQRARDHKKDVRLMIETHSEAIVNRIGDLIGEGKIAHDDVQICIFETDANTGDSSVSVAGYTAEGALENWPFGFFAPVRNLRGE